MVVTIDKEKDRITDFEYIKKTLTEEKNHILVSDRLSKYFTGKYGSEFGGYVKVSYNFLKQQWSIDCGDDRKATLEKGEAGEIASKMKYFREQASK